MILCLGGTIHSSECVGDFMYLRMFAAAAQEEIKSVNIKLNSPERPTMSNREKSKNIYNLNTSRSSWKDRRKVEKSFSLNNFYAVPMLLLRGGGEQNTNCRHKGDEIIIVGAGK